MMPLRGKEMGGMKDYLAQEEQQRAARRPRPVCPLLPGVVGSDSIKRLNNKVAAIPSSSLGKKRTRRETLPDIARRIPVDALRPYLMMSLVSAAKSLGISATTLKRLCRHYGIKRWPFRQISGIDRTVGRLQAELQASRGKPSSEEMLRPIAAHIHELHLHRQGMVELALEGGHEPIRGKLTSVGMIVNAIQGNLKTHTNHVRSPSMSSSDSFTSASASPLRVLATAGGGTSSQGSATIVTPQMNPARPTPAVAITTPPQASNRYQSAADAPYSFPMPGEHLNNASSVSAALLGQGPSRDSNDISAGLPSPQRLPADISACLLSSPAGGAASVAGAVAAAAATVAAAVAAEAAVATPVGEMAGTLSRARDPCNAAGAPHEHVVNTNNSSGQGHPSLVPSSVSPTSLSKDGIFGTVGVQLAPLRTCWSKDFSSSCGDGEVGSRSGSRGGSRGGGGVREAPLPSLPFQPGCDETKDLNALATALGFGEQLMARDGISTGIPSHPQPNVQYHDDYSLQYQRKARQHQRQRQHQQHQHQREREHQREQQHQQQQQQHQREQQHQQQQQQHQQHQQHQHQHQHQQHPQHQQTAPSTPWPRDYSCSIVSPCDQDEFDPTASDLDLEVFQLPGGGGRGRGSKKARREHSSSSSSSSMTEEDFNAIGELVFGKVDLGPAAVSCDTIDTVIADAAPMYGESDAGIPGTAIAAASGGGSSPAGVSASTGGGAASAIDMDLEFSTWSARVVEMARPSPVSLPDTAPWDFSGCF